MKFVLVGKGLLHAELAAVLGGEVLLGLVAAPLADAFNGRGQVLREVLVHLIMKLSKIRTNKEFQILLVDTDVRQL